MVLIHIIRSTLRRLVFIIENRPIYGIVALLLCYASIMLLLAGIALVVSYLDIANYSSSRYWRGLFGLALFFFIGPLILRCIDRVAFLGRSNAGDIPLRVLKILAGDV